MDYLDCKRLDGHEAVLRILPDKMILLSNNSEFIIDGTPEPHLLEHGRIKGWLACLEQGDVSVDDGYFVLAMKTTILVEPENKDSDKRLVLVLRAGKI